MHDLVIFDCDGVLVDSEPVSNSALVDNLARHGLDMSLEACMAQFVGGSMTGVMANARDLGADLPDDWIDEIYGEIYARLADGVNVVSGIPELLEELNAHGIPFCVASNGSRDKMRITLGQNGLWERFENVMFSAHEMGVSKPDPDLFQLAAAHFDAKQPVVIEDSASGVAAAMRANMRCLAYAAHDDGRALAALGAEVFHDMKNAPELIIPAR